MRIRRLDIEHFRGIDRASWRLPTEQTFFTLIGPGDSTKSTILTAIERALTDRTTVTFQAAISTAATSHSRSGSASPLPS